MPRVLICLGFNDQAEEAISSTRRSFRARRFCKVGVSWQIVPAMLGEWSGGKDPARSQRLMSALMKMEELDIARLRVAFERE